MVSSRAIGVVSHSGSKRGKFLVGRMLLALNFVFAICFVASNLAPNGFAQSNVTGAISGAVTDSTGAVVPGAKVVLTNAGTDAKQELTTNAEGRYTANSLPPGLYKITATAPGLQSDTLEVTVVIGASIPGDIKVTPTGNTTVVDVNAANLPLLDTQNVALATTFNEQQIQDLPMPGGDVTTVAFTLPGVVVNAGGAYGNFSSDGLPGISNLFVLNGFDNQDPFLNLNNSGSSNLTLGQGELAEATVVQNGYNSVYGRAAGAVINYTTKSGTNSFHGEADYNYNGTVLNANGWVNGYEGQARPHAVANQWAVNAGGPIIKDKVFFFGDFEGLRYVLPGSSGYLTFPSPQLATYIQGNVPAAAQSFYALALNDFTKSPAYKAAIPVVNGSGPNQDGNGDLGCGAAAAGGLAGTPAPGGGTFGTTVPCAVVGTASANNINKEWLFTGRGDWKINDKHTIYGRYKMDRGSQPTSTSFIDPLFSAISIQPEYEGQFNDTYVFSPNRTNVFVAAANWYSAYFGPVSPSASLAELPANFYFTDYGLDGSGVNASPGLAGEGVPYYLTQGRNVTQYQIEDDYRWIIGKHNLTFGGNFRRDLVEDYDSQVETIFPVIFDFSLGDFAAGQLSTSSPWYGLNSYGQAFTATDTAHLALYNLGVYIQDEFQVLPKLKLTLGVRADRTGNPVCHNGCFANYNGSFPGSGASLTSPYNNGAGGPISAQNWNPFPKVQLANIQPRFGFNYSIDEKTEIRGGVGIFADLYPAGFLDGAIQNFPNYNAVTVYSGITAPSGPGTVGANAAAANGALQSAFRSGGSITSINNILTSAGIPFSPPAVNAYFPGTFKVPEYAEYSLQIQRQLSKSDAIILTYAGNYGYDGVLLNPDLNAASGNYSNSTGTYVGPSFAGLPTTPADPRFSKVTAYTNNGHSNYNGASVQYKRSGHGVTGQVSYTYSHSLDLVSNGGSGEPFNGGSVTTQMTPNLGYGNLNYSNSDYDIRSNVVGDLIYETPFKVSNKIANGFVSGWIVGAKTYARTGSPFSITNGAALGNYHNLGGTLTPILAPGVTASSIINPTGSKPHSCTFTDCFSNASTSFVDFGPANAGGQPGFGDLRRNSFYGPHYVNTDLLLTKDIFKLERFKMAIGANAYNLFNHPNFGAPNGDISSGSFGQIQGTLAPPTSPYGSFQGAAVTQRLFQLHGRIIF
jgi:hypothetical protein